MNKNPYLKKMLYGFLGLDEVELLD